jgi:DNA replication and repair protein RecF
VLRYKKTLEQRNRVLKEGNSRFHSVLSDFTEALLDSGSRMIHARLAWLQDRSAAVPRLAAHIAPKQPPIGLKYHFRWKAPESTLPSENGDLTQIHFAGHTPLPSLEDLYRSMKASLRSLEHQEWRLGSSLVGPHRDDWFMEMDRNPLRTHGSQGEIRTALLALKLAEIESFRRVTGHRPILLLDDFSSELDLDRRRFLMDFLQTTDLQVFISSTESVGLPGKKFSVVSGVVTPA